MHTSSNQSKEAQNKIHPKKSSSQEQHYLSIIAR